MQRPTHAILLLGKALCGEGHFIDAGTATLLVDYINSLEEQKCRRNLLIKQLRESIKDEELTVKYLTRRINELSIKCHGISNAK